jgi:hypothetical protein
VSVLVQREAARIRDEWLGRTLSTPPADRPAAEAAISGLYRLIRSPPPDGPTGCTPGTYVVRRQREQEGCRARLVAD